MKIRLFKQFKNNIIKAAVTRIISNLAIDNVEIKETINKNIVIYFNNNEAKMNNIDKLHKDSNISKLFKIIKVLKEDKSFIWELSPNFDSLIITNYVLNLGFRLRSKAEDNKETDQVMAKTG